jgi:hypothetical protein
MWSQFRWVQAGGQVPRAEHATNQLFRLRRAGVSTACGNGRWRSAGVHPGNTVRSGDRDQFRPSLRSSPTRDIGKLSASDVPAAVESTKIATAPPLTRSRCTTSTPPTQTAPRYTAWARAESASAVCFLSARQCVSLRNSFVDGQLGARERDAAALANTACLSQTCSPSS